jgi:hypothetical protein
MGALRNSAAATAAPAKRPATVPRLTEARPVRATLAMWVTLWLMLIGVSFSCGFRAVLPEGVSGQLHQSPIHVYADSWKNLGDFLVNNLGGHAKSSELHL